MLLAGDAAGLCDPITCEGISSAIQSGQLAAKALVDGGLEEYRVKKYYESWLSNVILRELRLGRALAKLVYDHRSMLRRLFRLYGQEFTEAITDVVMGEKTYSQLLSDPSNYLSLFRIWYRRRKMEGPTARGGQME